MPKVLHRPESHEALSALKPACWNRALGIYRDGQYTGLLHHHYNADYKANATAQVETNRAAAQCHIVEAYRLRLAATTIASSCSSSAARVGSDSGTPPRILARISAASSRRPLAMSQRGGLGRKSTVRRRMMTGTT